MTFMTDFRVTVGVWVMSLTGCLSLQSHHHLLPSDSESGRGSSITKYDVQLYEKCFITTRCTFTVTNETYTGKRLANRHSCVSVCRYSHTHTHI